MSAGGSQQALAEVSAAYAAHHESILAIHLAYLVRAGRGGGDAAGALAHAGCAEAGRANHESEDSRIRLRIYASRFHIQIVRSCSTRLGCSVVLVPTEFDLLTLIIMKWQVVEHWIAVSYKTSQVTGCLMESHFFITLLLQ